jgi:hypothetical protein
MYMCACAAAAANKLSSPSLLAATCYSLLATRFSRHYSHSLFTWLLWLWLLGRARLPSLLLWFAICHLFRV